MGLDCGIPNDSRLDGRSWLGVNADDSRLDGRSTVGVWTVEALLPPVRFLLLRIVTVAGMDDWPSAEPLRGDARGGVEVGAGNFERADLSRCSRFVIFVLKPRIWWRDPEWGRPDA